MSTSSRASQPPAPRLLRTWQDAEDYAAEYVRWLGWPQARATRRTGDEGIDVLAETGPGVLVAQVKMEVKPVESKVVRELRGAGVVVGATHHVMFALAGYKPPAIDWADRADVALFEFAYDGTVNPVNAVALQLLDGAGRSVTPAEPAAPTAAAPEPPRPTGPIGELRRDDLQLISAAEQWERADRSHIDPHATYTGLPAYELAQRAGVDTGYATAAYFDLRRYLDMTVLKSPEGEVWGYTVRGIKPYGVKALRAWGIAVQDWRG